MTRLRFALLAVMALLPAFAEAQLAKPERHVTDRANILAPEEITKLEAELQAIEDAALAQAIVYLEPSLPAGAVMEELTLRSVNDWGVGRREVNDGLAIFAFMGDRKVRIEVGLGLEKKISNDAAKKIIDQQIAPAFRAGDYAKGLMDAVRQLRRLLEPEYVVTSLGRAIRIEGPANAPRVLEREWPVYPETARQAGITGTVQLVVLIDETGRVRNVTVVKGLAHGLSTSAVDAVKRWRFEPVKANGAAVPALVDVVMQFKL